MKEFDGSIIRKLRNQRGFTQDQLAEACNTTRSTIARYEAGEIQPKRAKAVALAEALGVTTDEVLGAQKTPEHTPGADVINAGYYDLTPEHRQSINDLIVALAAADRKDASKP